MDILTALLWLTVKRRKSTFHTMHPSSDRPGAARQIDNELPAEGYVNERGKPINPKSIKAMIDG